MFYNIVAFSQKLEVNTQSPNSCPMGKYSQDDTAFTVTFQKHQDIEIMLCVICIKELGEHVNFSSAEMALVLVTVIALLAVFYPLSHSLHHHLQDQSGRPCIDAVCSKTTPQCLSESEDTQYQSLSFVSESQHYCQTQPLIVYVDGVKGSDSHQCLDPSSAMKPPPCKTLSFVSENLTQTDLVTIKIVSDTLILTKAVNFTGYTNLKINGSGGNTTLCCNESDAGLAFEKVKNFSITSLTIENCGALRPSTSVDHNQTTIDLPVAVYIFNCTNVSIVSVNIVSSIGTGLSLYDTNGQVDIVNCDFTGNSVGKNESGGGGVRIEFTICSPGLDMQYCGSHNGQNSNSRYTIHNCNFTENSVSTHNANYNFLPPLKQQRVPQLGKGGGLYISIRSNAMNNTFMIDNCSFENNSAVYFGGGMFVDFIDSAENSTVIVNETHFEGNICTQTQFSGGGGLVVVTDSQPQNKANSFSCHSCTFTNNSGNMAGGVAILTAKNNCQAQWGSITFFQCKWMNNKATMGAAVFISPSISDYTKEGSQPFVTFTDCMFDSNSAIQPLKPPMAEGYGVKVESVGHGAVFISELRVVFKKSANFCNNMGSAVHLSNSVIEFRAGSNVTFFNNTSHIGGAIAMFGSSAIEIDNSSQFLFRHNSAYSRGGAIYFDFNAATHPPFHNCFIIPKKLSRVNSTLIFINNSAEASGSSIFTTTFQSCALLCSSSDTFNSPKEIMECIAQFRFDKTNSSLSTRPDTFNLTRSSPVIKLIPGMEYSLNLSVSDEANTTLHSVVYQASVTGNRNVTLDPAFVQVSNNTVKVLGNEGANASMHLITPDLIVSFNISLMECPPGYMHGSSTRRCECVASKYWGVIGCYPNVYLKQGYWIGYCSNKDRSELCTAICSYGFCSYNGLKKDAGYYVLPNSTKSLTESICSPNRTDRFCGRCSDNYTVYHNSWKFKCGPETLCDFGWFFYILSDIIPVTLLFFVVLVMNISFTTGNTNTFVLYGQILGHFSLTGNDGTKFSPSIKLIQRAVTLIYNSFNMNFFAVEELSYCLWKEATFMGAMLMNYATVAFALGLVIVTIFATKLQWIRSKIFFKFHRRDSILIHGLSAFFILCYSQASRITFNLLSYSCLFLNEYKCQVLVVTYAGHIDYLTGEHIPFAVLAFLVLIFMIVIPPLLLLVYPLVFKLLGLCKLSETRLAHVLWRVMPIHFLDAFQSSFKNKYRFFAGLYFLYRAAILALYVMAQSWVSFYAMVQLMLIIILSLHSLVQPHKEMKHNIIDSLLFSNICLINAISLYYYSITEIYGPFRSGVVSAIAICQALLIIWPLFFVIVLWLVKWRRHRKPRVGYESLPSLREDHDFLIQ